MDCVDCKKQFDFTGAFRLECGCVYCTKCVVKKMKKFRSLTHSIIGCNIECCDITDYNFVFSTNSQLEGELFLFDPHCYKNNI